MQKIIALDDGHGMETPGKRSPMLPDGTYMPENEFNRTVVKYLASDLERNGFSVLLVAPGDDDTPLNTRTDLANNTIRNKYNRPADLYISVHANAATGDWNSANGLETYIYTKTDAETDRLGKLVHDNLIKGTPQFDRGLKRADFHVLRETHMPAVLVECGFMDNKQDIQLLLSDSFRKECAEELCKAVCEFYGVKYVGEQTKNTVKIKYEGKVYDLEGTMVDDKNYVGVRALAELLGFKVDWDDAEKTVLISK